ncbi:D-alanyl-D-alanine carboxypeptidase/D-alanyl-D-alanine endopeptidase [Nocardioides nanhaiensis]|uniref:Serine-type D-Ala-D-Ala carboxypeptidase n=1 Tax=Nocardioides nanhaiensis TaxID=1476871 RepID=A0ABP8W8X9_9ACTN
MLVLALVLVAAGLVSWRLGWLEEHAAPALEAAVDQVGEWVGLGDDDAPPPSDDPGSVAAPPELALPPLTRPAVAAPAVEPAALASSRVRAAVQPWLAERSLGRHVIGAVGSLEEGPAVFEQREGAPTAVPASTTKVVTTTAALLALGPDHTFTTRVVAGGGDRVVLVGGGDPLLARQRSDETTPYPARADLETLAQRTARALRRDGVRRVSLGYDDSLFTGPAVNPTWEADYVPDGVVSPITALWADQGRDPDGFGRVADPALDAAQTFARALQAVGVRVVGAPERGVAGTGGATLASVSSAPLGEIVERVMDVSDNEAAEVLLRHVGLAEAGEGSSAAGQRAVRALLQREGVQLQGVLHDGSGLSRANRLAPFSLVQVLRLAAAPEHPELRHVATGMPVAGFTGSLDDRFDGPLPDARGRVRAKTGTLTNVFALAGYAVGPDGVPMAFALMADRIDPQVEGLAQPALDNAAAALGACRCGA